MRPNKFVQATGYPNTHQSAYPNSFQQTPSTLPPHRTQMHLSRPQPESQYLVNSAPRQTFPTQSGGQQQPSFLPPQQPYLPTQQQLGAPAQSYSQASAQNPVDARPETLLQRKDPRIDSTSIPRPASQHERLTEPGGKRINASNQTGPPPPAASYVTFVEEGDSTPRYIRSSLGLIPQSKVTFETSKIPFCVVTCPFPILNTFERPPPQVDLSPFSPIFSRIRSPVWNNNSAASKGKRPGPPRCPKCGAYVCPSFVFASTTAGCCFCGERFTLPSWYCTILEEYRRNVGNEAEMRERLNSTYDLKEGLSYLSHELIRSELLVGSVDYVTHAHPEVAKSASVSWRKRPPIGIDRSQELGGSTDVSLEDISRPYEGAGYEPSDDPTVQDQSASLVEKTFLRTELAMLTPVNTQCAVFVIDCTTQAQNSGFTESIFMSIKHSVRVWPACQLDLAVITFTDNICLYRHNSQAGAEQEESQSLTVTVSVVGDVNEPFVPAPPSSLFLRVKCGSSDPSGSTHGPMHSGDQFDSYVDRILYLERKRKEDELNEAAAEKVAPSTDNCAIAALQVAADLVVDRSKGPERSFLEPLRGGLVSLFTTSYPTRGICAIVPNSLSSTPAASGGQPNAKHGSSATDVVSMAATKIMNATSASVGGMVSSNDESNIYSPNPLVARGLENIVEQCVQNAICIETFVASFEERHAASSTSGSPLGDSKLSLGSLGFLSSQTGGQCHLYRNFSIDLEYEHLFYDIHRLFSVPFGMDCTFKIRVSKGVMVKAVLCPWASLKTESGGFGRDATAFHVPRLTGDVTIVFELAYAEEELSGKTAYLQVACAYTNLYGHRMLRVLNRQSLISASMSSIFRHAEVESTTVFYSRKMLMGVMGGQMQRKEELIKSLMDLLLSYRVNSAAASPYGQLILPESLKLLPVYITGLLKSTALRTNANADERVHTMLTLMGCTVAKITRILYPLVYPLIKDARTEDYSSQSMGTRTEVADFFFVPPSIPSSGEHITTNGVFLMDNSFHYYIYIGKDVEGEVIRELAPAAGSDLNLSKVNLRLPAIQTGLPETSILKRVWNVINQLRLEKMNQAFQPVRVVLPGSLAESTFIWQLTEDRLGSEKGYVDFLCDIHRQVQKELNLDN